MERKKTEKSAKKTRKTMILNIPEKQCEKIALSAQEIGWCEYTTIYNIKFIAVV